MSHALPGEYYVELDVPGVQSDGRTSFPARLEVGPMTLSNVGASPRLRPAVILDLQRWLSDNPGGRIRLVTAWTDPSGLPNGPVTVYLSDDDSEWRGRIWPDSDGLYPLYGNDPWFWHVSVPASSPAAIKSTKRKLVKPRYLRPEPGEEYVTLGHTREAFPAVLDTASWHGDEQPRFRPQVARIFSAWLNHAHLFVDEAYSRVYWEDDIMIFVDSSIAAAEGYRPARVAPDDERRYAIGRPGWSWITT